MEKMKNKRFIAYYRVSTEQQGQSGLGLSAQQRIVRDFCQSSGELLGEFTDVESGKNDQRANLDMAMDACVRLDAVLVVKDLSRVSRGGYGVMMKLQDAGVEYIEAGSPYDNQLIKEIKFSLAREEREKISGRTSLALQEIKEKIANGMEHVSKSGRVVTSLGNPENLTDDARAKGRVTHQRLAYNRSKQSGSYAVALYKSGVNKSGITKLLNENGFTTARGKSFSITQTGRLLDRYLD